MFVLVKTQRTMAVLQLDDSTELEATAYSEVFEQYRDLRQRSMFLTDACRWMIFAVSCRCAPTLQH